MHDETNPDPGGGPACGLSAHLLRTKQSLRYDHETKPESDPRVGQGVPAERPSEPLESDFPQPLRHYARCRSLHPPERLRETARHRRQRSVRRRERASLGPLCPDAGRTGIPHRRLRPVLHRRKRRRAPLRRFARHQYRGFQRRGRLPLDARRRGPRTDRYPRHLRIAADSQSTRRRSTRGSRRRWLPQCTTSAAARRTDISTRWIGRRTLRTPPAAQRPAHGRRKDGHLRARPAG